MTNNLFIAVAAACPSTGTMPTLLPTAADAWRSRVPARIVDSGLRGTSVVKTLSHHNSITRPLAVPASAYRGVEAKQAAPPRGVLR